MGDPAGIGPEITAKMLADPAVYERCMLVVGDASVMGGGACANRSFRHIAHSQNQRCPGSAVSLRFHRCLRYGTGASGNQSGDRFPVMAETQRSSM